MRVSLAALQKCLFLCSLVSGTTNGRAATAPPAGPRVVSIPVMATTPGKGYLSLALYDKKGVLVRSLLYAKPVEADRQWVEWDGTTDMQGFWPKKAGGTNPRTITSSAESARFEQINEVPGLKMAYKVGAKGEKTGWISYIVEASMPLESLGLENPAGKRIGFDASVRIAHASGDRRVRAVHCSGTSEAVVVDRPGSARLLPDTWGSLNFAPPVP